jgi:hypothetical protein
MNPAVFAIEGEYRSAPACIRVDLLCEGLPLPCRGRYGGIRQLDRFQDACRWYGSGWTKSGRANYPGSIDEEGMTALNDRAPFLFLR